MQRLDQTAIGMLCRLLGDQPTTPAKVEFAWKIAAGSSLARAATLSWSANGILRVVARSEHWRTEIVRAKPVIATRLGQLLGPGVVRRLTIEAAPGASLSPGPARRTSG
jgi:hypothetical protein